MDSYFLCANCQTRALRDLKATRLDMENRCSTKYICVFRSLSVCELPNMRDLKATTLMSNLSTEMFFVARILGE